ncbi:MAG TPA: GFA family protein [Woeseiaceae bacterium]|nr:GFA family protein [Woeseiaceae bacterium]
MAETIQGGCHCGALRYRVIQRPIDTGYCHCHICQLTTGAPVLAWLHVPTAGFELTKGTPKVYRSSSWGERWFCSGCGTQLLYRDSEGPTTVDINVGSLDRPEIARPARHIFTASRIPWFDTADDLPRHEGSMPTGGKAPDT